MYDELRDYRFYSDDMIHPSSQAIEYIWERFAAAAFSPQTRQIISDIEQINRAAEHRANDTQSEAHKRFCAQMIDKIKVLEVKCSHIDMRQEKEYFNTYL